MNRLKHKKLNRGLRKSRIRKSVIGTNERPRLAVFVSNRNITAQLVDDDAGKTIAYVTTVGEKAAGNTMTKRAEWVGTEVAKKAVASKHKKIVLDRSGKRYHGRVKALADAARKVGLEF